MSVLETVHWRYGGARHPLWYQSYNRVILFQRLTAGTAVVSYPAETRIYHLGFSDVFHTHTPTPDLWCTELAMLYIERGWWCNTPMQTNESPMNSGVSWQRMRKLWCDEHLMLLSPRNTFVVASWSVRFIPELFKTPKCPRW